MKTLAVCDFCCCVLRCHLGYQSACPGAVAPQLWFLFGAWERGGSKSSPLELLARKEVLESASESRRFWSTVLPGAAHLPSGAAGLGLSWHQASVRGTAQEHRASCLPPAVFFGTPVPLQSRAPLASKCYSFKQTGPAKLSGWITKKSVSEASFGPSLRELSDPFMAAARLASSLLVGGHLQSCEHLSTRDPAWASLVRSPGAGLSFVHC